MLNQFIHLKQNNMIRNNLNLIPLNNNIDKLVAFVPSLNKDWRNNQLIKSKPFQIESLDVVREFQQQGWYIKGASEIRDKSRKIKNHFIKMEHPDFIIRNKKGQTEAVANMTIQNSCNGSKPLEMDLGVYRMICSNGAIAHTSYSNAKVSHTEKGLYSLNEILCDLGIRTQGVINEFDKLKHKDLSAREMMALASDAANVRFGIGNKVNAAQLLNVIRDEDKGNDIWTVFNRIQENLTQSNRIKDANMKLLGGVSNVYEDTRINKELFQLAHSYA
jgi:hypothetical protein